MLQFSAPFIPSNFSNSFSPSFEFGSATKCMHIHTTTKNHVCLRKIWNILSWVVEHTLIKSKTKPYFSFRLCFVLGKLYEFYDIGKSLWPPFGPFGWRVKHGGHTQPLSLHCWFSILLARHVLPSRFDLLHRNTNCTLRCLPLLRERRSSRT